MNLWQKLVTIAIAAATNFGLRYLPFGFFKGNRVTPFIKGLGNFLPPAIMSMLVVYCFRNVNWLGASHGLPEVIAGLVTAGLHLWRGQIFLSLLGGTACYILLINFIF